MINHAVSTIVAELNTFFNARSGLNDIVVPGNLLTQAGSITVGLDNHIIASIVNLEEDRISRSKDIYRKQPNGRVQVVNPEIRLNLYLLFISCFDRTNSNEDGYTDGLGYLSNVIAFFQKKPYFNSANTPGLHPAIDKLLIEMTTLNLEQVNHLWGSLGAKYLPSVMYKVRLVIIQEEELASDGPPITELHINSTDSN